MFRRKPAEPPEWLIVGLGNPGGEYDGTRHNVGFEVIKELVARHRIRKSERRFSAHYAVHAIVPGVPVALVRPMTFMNLSGRAVAALCRHFSVPTERVIAVYDDMDLETGRVLLKPHGGPGTHNGMKSIVSSLGSNQFPRIRIGIGKPALAGVDHVLARFDREEIPVIREAIVMAADACEIAVRDGWDIAMNRTNLPKAEE